MKTFSFQLQILLIISSSIINTASSSSSILLNIDYDNLNKQEHLLEVNIGGVSNKALIDISEPYSYISTSMILSRNCKSLQKKSEFTKYNGDIYECNLRFNENVEFKMKFISAKNLNFNVILGFGLGNIGNNEDSDYSILSNLVMKGYVSLFSYEFLYKNSNNKMRIGSDKAQNDYPELYNKYQISLDMTKITKSTLFKLTTYDNQSNKEEVLYENKFIDEKTRKMSVYYLTNPKTTENRMNIQLYSLFLEKVFLSTTFKPSCKAENSLSDSSVLVCNKEVLGLLPSLRIYDVKGKYFELIPHNYMTVNGNYLFFKFTSHKYIKGIELGMNLVQYNNVFFSFNEKSKVIELYRSKFES